MEATHEHALRQMKFGSAKHQRHAYKFNLNHYFVWRSLQTWRQYEMLCSGYTLPLDAEFCNLVQWHTFVNHLTSYVWKVGRLVLYRTSFSESNSLSVKILPAFYRTPRFMTVFTRARHSSLSLNTWIQPTHPHPPNRSIYINIIFPSTSRFSKWSGHFDQKLVRILTSPTRATRLSNLLSLIWSP